MQNPNSHPLSGIMARLPTGLAGAVFWLGLWFCVLYVRRWIPGGFGTFLGFIQFFVGIALFVVAIPFLWGFVRRNMLWSLRNKLVLTYLLIGLAPVILLVTLVSAMAYVAAGQFAIHLVDSRLLSELGRMTNENERRAEVASLMLQHGSSTTPLEAAIDSDRGTTGDASRRSLRRDPEVFINGAPVALTTKTVVRDKNVLGLPPWATEIPGGHFSSLVLDGNELFFVAIHQERWND